MYSEVIEWNSPEPSSLVRHTWCFLETFQVVW